MPLQVVFQLRAKSVPLITKVALESFSLMTQAVKMVIGFLRKAFTTLTALKWFYTCVLVHMVSQLHFVDESFTTNMT